MYMTVIKINNETLANQEYFMDFSDMDFMHKWVTSQVHNSREEENILYRFEDSKNDKGTIWLYIQTDNPFPQKNIGRAGMGFFRSKEIKDINPGDKVYFKLLGSADKKDFVTQKNVFIKDINKRRDWLKRKFESCAEITDFRETGITKKTIKGGVNITAADFEGYAVITDPEKFLKIVHKGVGRCKNYGLGLVMFNKVS